MTGVQTCSLPSEARQGAGTDRDVPADLHVAAAQFAGDDPDARVRIGVGDPEQLLGQQFAEAAVGFEQDLLRGRVPVAPAGLDPRSEGRSVGKESERTWRSRWWPHTYPKKN